MTIETVGKKCCACRSCQTACPAKAITFGVDSLGFEYPRIGETKCIDCGKCTKVCPALNEIGESTTRLCGAAYSLDAETKFKGSSGGLFGTFARKTIDDGGVVYGAAFDENLKLKTKKAATLEELQPLYKSKYLLCNTDDKFSEIKADLQSGKKVLYCSSPCQVQALKLFLGREYDNLFTIDFVCHGVGSQTLWDKSVEYVEKKKGIKILSFTMRHKPKKPSSHYYYYYYRDLMSGKEKSGVNIFLKFPYYHAYERRLLCRASCYDCKFASMDRVSDITIGDFHNIAKYNQNIDRFAGVSMFVCNTDKGKSMFDSLRNELYVEEYDWDIIKTENRFTNNEKQSKKSVDFLNIASKSFSDAVSVYLNPYKDITFYYYKCPKFVRDLARKVFRR